MPRVLQLNPLFRLQSIIDLRQAPVACRVHTHNMVHMMWRLYASFIAWIKHKILRQPYHLHRRRNGGGRMDEAALREAKPCWRCTEACEITYGVRAQVFHVDLLPGAVTFFIFAALPSYLQAKVIYLTLRKQKPEAVVAAAVADPQVLGFLKLYIIILERSKANIAAALRLLLRDEHLPALIHCVHGKDRTGIIVMLIYLLCDVPHQVIIDDYAKSESLLRESRDHQELLDLPEALTRDQIIASAANVMEGTVAYLTRKYGDVNVYLRSTGMEQEEIDGIRGMLMRRYRQRSWAGEQGEGRSNGAGQEADQNSQDGDPLLRETTAHSRK